MAAGRFSVSRRKDLHDYSKKEYDCYKNGLCGHEFSKDRDRDVGKRNGYHKYSSNARKLGINGDSHQRGGIYVRTKDREPVQLSSGSENQKAFAFHTCDEDGEIENGVQLPPEKKRKFSPIVWDIEEKDVKGLSKHRIVPTGASPSPSSSLKSDNVIANIDLDGIFRTDSPTADQPHGKELSLVEPHVASGSAESTITECSAACSSLSQGRCGDENLKEEQLEEAEFVGARNISMSRWASESDSPADIGISDDEDIPKRNKMARNGDVSELLLNTQFSSPECGEFLREDSEGDRARSYGTDGGGLVSPASGEKYSDDDLYRNDDMEIGEDNASAVGSELDSDSDSEDDNDCSKNQEPRVPNRRVDMLQSCRCVFDYEKLNKINEGTYGVVYRARDKQTGEIVALKKVKMGVERDGFPLSSLREINILSSFHHPSIVNVKEVVMGDLDSVFMVMEYMEHDLKGLMEVMKQPFSISEVKCLMLQLLEGVKYLHDNWVLHRDLKSSNLLVNNRGELKICDFGLSRQYGSPLKPYTPLVVTLWYRAPELLLGTKKYSTAIDMWSVGCIMAELLSKEPLFKGKSEVDQLDKIFRTLGTPNETIWSGFSELPGAKANFVKQRYNLLRKKFPAASFTGSPTLSESGFDLLSKLLTYDPAKRITVEAALNHEWFCEVPLPKSKEFMPTFPAQNAQDRYRHK